MSDPGGDPLPPSMHRTLLRRWLPVTVSPRERLVLISLALLAILTFWTFLQRDPFGVDWRFTYRPAARAVLRGQNPYITDEVLPFGPPWTVIPLIPFALLPEAAGRSLFAVVSLGVFAYLAIRMGAKPLGVLAFLLSVPVTACVQVGNVEPLALLGLFLPPQIGLLFLTMKPQGTSAIILLYAVRAWRQGRWQEVLRQFWPLALLTALSLLIYPWWPLRWLDAGAVAGTNNVSLWPSSIPIGLTLLVMALRDDNLKPALVASPLLSPYTVVVSWAGAVLALAPSTLEIAAASIGTWIFWAFFHQLGR